MRYEIQAGDTLSEIAYRNGTTVGELLKANPSISNPNKISAGSMIQIAPGKPLPVAAPVSSAVDMGMGAENQMCVVTKPANGTVMHCSVSSDSSANPFLTPLVDFTNEALLYTPIPTDPMDETDFGKKFQTITGGSKLSQTIAQYEKDTGKNLSPETVETLFTDADKAKKLLMVNKSLHTTYRNILNQNIPATKEAAEKAGFKKMNFGKSIFHAPWKNTKWISQNGHLEAVYGKDGSLDNSLKYKGTFNFFGPDDASGHKKTDVDPYFEWGN